MSGFLKSHFLQKLLLKYRPHALDSTDEDLIDIRRVHYLVSSINILMHFASQHGGVNQSY